MKFLFLQILLFVFLSRSLINGRSRECFNEAWHYVTQFVVWVSKDFLIQTYIFDYLFIWLTIKSRM